jgi:hypothetical protein
MNDPAGRAPPAVLPGDGLVDGSVEAAVEMLARRYTKTEAGRTEIRQRALPLSRPARNLLLIIDPGRSAADWVGLVQGCDPAALQALRDAGLVADTGPAARGAPAAAGASAAWPLRGAAAPRMSLAQALEHRSYQALYERITAEARPRLGLIKGYKMIMEVERCSGPAEMRALAQRFVDQLRAIDGDLAGMALAQVLIAPE